MSFVTLKNGRIQSRKIEYNLVDHCNLRCANCSHLSPYQPKGAALLSVFERDLRLLAPVYRVQRFRFVGGEPLLHRSLQEFVDLVRRSGIAEEVEVVTNGVLLGRVSDAVIHSLDRLTLSCYPGINTDVDAQRKRCTALGVKFITEEISRFRRMDPSGPIDDEELIRSIYETCMIAHTWSCQTFSDGYFYVCSRPLYLGAYLGLSSDEARSIRESDGVALDAPDLQQRLTRAMARTAPLSSCRYCLGTVGKYEKWRQLDVAEVRIIDRPPVPARSMISARRMQYLLIWRRMERVLLRLLPSARLAKWLSLLQTASVRD